MINNPYVYPDVCLLEPAFRIICPVITSALPNNPQSMDFFTTFLFTSPSFFALNKKQAPQATANPKPAAGAGFLMKPLVILDEFEFLMFDFEA